MGVQLIESREFLSSTSATTLTISPAATMLVGDWAVLFWVGNVFQGVNSVADNSVQSGTANAWSLVSGIGATNLTLGSSTCWLTRSILSSNTITVTLPSSASRRNLRLVTFRGFVVSPGFNTTDLSTTTVTTSPVLLTPGVAGVGNIGNLVVGASGWLGGAVASGVANSNADWTLITAAGSGGTTTRVEVNVAWGQGIGAVTNHSFTSITRATSRVLTANVDADYTPKPPRAYNRPNMSWARRASGILVPRYPSTVTALRKAA
jgi:hypothetical protein